MDGNTRLGNSLTRKDDIVLQVRVGAKQRGRRSVHQHHVTRIRHQARLARPSRSPRRESERHISRTKGETDTDPGERKCLPNTAPDVESGPRKSDRE